MDRKILTALVVLGLLVGAIFVFQYGFGARYTEVQDLNKSQLTFSEYEDYFQKLAEDKGAAYAFEVLKRAAFPSGIDIHLLGHVVGDVLYKQQGLKGIKICTPDFRNACSHSIVIGLFNERGVAALNDIAEACRNAPGGVGAYTMCFHGLGHGILAYTGYDMKKAVDLCKKTGTPERQDREYIECVGGTMMEMIAGVNDPTAWDLQKSNYFSKTDPLSPCDQSFIPDDAKPICYTYLTPRLFEAAGTDLASPQPEFYQKAFSYCDALPKENRAQRDACYGGFGKEFVVLAQGRDVRDIGSSKEEALANVRSWCSFAENKDGELACDANALASLFWGGENNPDASFLFCSLATDPALQGECYAQLAQSIVFYLKGSHNKATPLCERLPEPHRSFCMSNT